MNSNSFFTQAMMVTTASYLVGYGLNAVVRDLLSYHKGDCYCGSHHTKLKSVRRARAIKAKRSFR